MAKRTGIEIENDYKRIKALVDAIPVTSITEIAQKLNLSESEVKTSLARHPRVEKRVLAQLKKSKDTLKSQKVINRKSGSNKHSKPETVQGKSENTNLNTGFVIDASLVDTEKWEEILSMIFVTKEKIFLTSVTIHELAKLQKFHDEAAVAARRILAMAAENKEKFYPVMISENAGEPDDCIVKYCAENKHTVTLLTADKEMVLKARMYGVKTEYFPHKNAPTHLIPTKKKDKTSSVPVAPTQKEVAALSMPAIPTQKEDATLPMPAAPTKKEDNTTAMLTDKKSNTSINSKKSTLPYAQIIGDKLCISDLNEGNKSVMVISNRLEYTDGPLELNIGDEVYVATKVLDYITFHHYEVTSLSAKNNCDLICFKRFFRNSDIFSLKNSNYKKFMNAFMIRHDM